MTTELIIIQMLAAMLVVMSVFTLLLDRRLQQMVGDEVIPSRLVKVEVAAAAVGEVALGMFDACLGSAVGAVLCAIAAGVNAYVTCRWVRAGRSPRDG